jgi:hypothetical protein
VNYKEKDYPIAKTWNGSKKNLDDFIKAILAKGAKSASKCIMVSKEDYEKQEEPIYIPASPSNTYEMYRLFFQKGSNKR